MINTQDIGFCMPPSGGTGGGTGATAEQLAQIAQNTDDIAELRAAIDIQYNALVNTASSAADVDTLFASWWRINWREGETTRNELISRWFENVLYDDRVHGAKLPLFDTSNTAIGEFTDDSVGLTCVPSTAATAGQDDFAKLPQFWCLEVAAEKNTDGTHTIYAVEHIDDISTVRSGEHLCWVLQKNTHIHEYIEDGYHYFKICCNAVDGWDTWPQGTDKNGTVYPYIANPKYYAGIGADGLITCGTGLAPVNYTSHNSGVQLWRERSAHYAGASGHLLKWQLAMTWLKYACKGNSGTIEGCTNYNYQYAAAVSEVGVERIVLTAAQASNLRVGCNIILGDKGTGTSTDRGTASMYKLCRNKRIRAIEDITIEDVAYKAVYVDNGGTLFDTVAETTYISTMPYFSGWNDEVKGNDGSRYSYTNGREPGLIQKTEFMVGSYLIVADELLQWSKNADEAYQFDCYTCDDQSKVTTNGSISADYSKQSDLTLTFPSNQSGGWQYIEDIAPAKTLWPAAVSSRAGSGTGVKAGVTVYPAASGVRAAWCCGGLGNVGLAGLACRNSNNGTTNANWNGSVGSQLVEKNTWQSSYIASYIPRLCAKIA